MRKPPPAIAVIGALFLALAALELYLGLAPLFRSPPAHLAADDLAVAALGVAAALGGTFLLFGHDWARWLVSLWMGFHVVLSLHEPVKLLIHILVFALLLVVLFRTRAAAYFRSPAGG